MKQLLLTILLILSFNSLANDETVTVDGADMIDKLEAIVEPLTDGEGMDCEAKFYIARNVVVMGSIWIKASLTKSEADNDDFNLKIGLKCKNGKERLRAVAVIMAKKENVTIKRLKIAAHNLSLN